MRSPDFRWAATVHEVWPEYPELFALAGSFSGDTGRVSLKGSGNDRKSIDITFGPLESANRKANDISDAPEITPEKVSRCRSSTLIAVPKTSSFKQRDLNQLSLRERSPDTATPWRSRWNLDKQVREFLQVADRGCGYCFRSQMNFGISISDSDK